MAFEPDLDRVKMNQITNIYAKGHFVRELSPGQTDRHTTDIFWTTVVDLIGLEEVMT